MHYIETLTFANFQILQNAKLDILIFDIYNRKNPCYPMNYIQSLIFANLQILDYVKYRNCDLSVLQYRQTPCFTQCLI